MRTLRILHTSDFLAGAPAFNLNRAQDALDVELRGKPQFDYVVVCGNLTADGRPQSFAQARELLETLRDKNLVNGAEGWRRIVIVPGQFDVATTSPSSPNFDNFAAFHDDFFREPIEANELERFDPSRATLRELKDLTLLGACYWNTKRESLRPVKILDKAVRAAGQSANDIAYCNSTPTILVTADSPVSSWKTRVASRRAGFGTTLEGRLHLDLHLFGSHSTFCRPTEPFTFRHVGLSTGPREERNPWPLRANLLELSVWDPEDTERPETFFTVTACQFDEAKNDWEHNDIIEGHLDRYFKRPEACRYFVHPDLLTAIKDLIEHKRVGIHPMLGLPGAGLESLPPTRYWPEKLADVDVDIEFVRWTTYEAADRRVKAVLGRARRSSFDGAKGTRRVIVIYDGAFGYGSSSKEDEKDLAEIINYLRRKKKAGDLIVYGVAAARLPSAVTRDIDPSDVRTIGKASILTLQEIYQTRVPVDAEHLGRTTGGYAGFGTLLLDETVANFSKYGGTEAITDSTARNLLQRAQDADGVKRAAERFAHVVQRRPAGRAVFKLIRDRVENALAQASGATTASFTEAEAKNVAGADSSDVAPLLRFLEDRDVIKEGGKGKYELCVILPFLVTEEFSKSVAGLAQARPPAGQEPNRASAGKVFLSYNRADGAFASKLNARLIEKGVETWFDKKDIGKGDPWLTEVENAIDTMRCAVVLLGPGGWGKTQQLEKTGILTAHNDRDVKVVPVLLRNADTSEIKIFGHFNWIDLADEDDDLDVVVTAVELSKE